MHDVETSLARSVFYEVASLGFSYPSDEVLDYVSEQLAGLSLTVKAAGFDPDTAEKCATFLSLGTTLDRDEIKRGYTELFIGGQQCRLDESEYSEHSFYRQQRMADAAGFYRAFGFEVATDGHQRADFIGTELEFKHVLLLKQAYAIEKSWEDKAEACLDAEGKFFHEHLEWWIPTLCEKMRDVSSCAYYMSLSEYLESLARSETSVYPLPV